MLTKMGQDGSNVHTSSHHNYALLDDVNAAYWLTLVIPADDTFGIDVMAMPKVMVYYQLYYPVSGPNHLYNVSVGI